LTKKARQRLLFGSDWAGAIRTRFNISLPDSRRSPMAGRVHEATIVGESNWFALQLREPAMERCTTAIREPWNKGRLVGQKAPLKLKENWAIRVRLQLANRRRETGAVQPRHRQQASSLRLGQAART